MLVFGERNRGAGRGYWHEMGTEAQDPDTTAAEIAESAGLNYEVTKRAVSTRINGKHHNIEGTYALVSSCQADPAVIAVVGKEFEPIQNMHLAEMLDRAGLVGPGGIYSMDVAGKTMDGRTVFWSLKARDPFTVKGDEYRNHWVIMDGKDGNRALTMALTPVRFICSNALAMAVSGASLKVGIQHTKAAHAELGWWMGIAPQLNSMALKTQDTLNRLADRLVSEDDVDAILAGAYPLPKVRGRAQLFEGLETLALNAGDAKTVEQAQGSHNTERQRAIAKRDFVLDVFTNYADDPEEKALAGTALGVINAVADVENHRTATNVREVVGISNLYGPRYQAQAGSIKAALAL